jgi:hypothetical protein
MWPRKGKKWWDVVKNGNELTVSTKCEKVLTFGVKLSELSATG